MLLLGSIWLCWSFRLVLCYASRANDFFAEGLHILENMICSHLRAQRFCLRDRWSYECIALHFMRTLCLLLQVHHWFCCFLTKPSLITQALSLIVMFLFLSSHMSTISAWFTLEAAQSPSSCQLFFLQALSSHVRLLHFCFTILPFMTLAWHILF